MMDDNFFADFFGKYMDSAVDVKDRLDEYWQRGKIKEYYELLNLAKQNHKVMRNSDGVHKLERR